MANLGVEIALGTLGLAERPLHIDAEGFGHVLAPLTRREDEMELFSSEQVTEQQFQGPAARRELVLFVMGHLGEAAGLAIGHEDRVIAVA